MRFKLQWVITFFVIVGPSFAKDVEKPQHQTTEPKPELTQTSNASEETLRATRLFKALSNCPPLPTKAINKAESK